MRFLYVLCLAGFASSITWRAVDPMLPVMASSLKISLREAALISSAYTFPYAMMQLAFGPAGDAFGKSRLIRLSLAVVAASLAFTAVAPGYGSVLVVRAVAGAFAGGLAPMSIALLGDRVVLAERQVAIGRFLVAAIFGQVFGAAASGMLVGIVGWRVVFALAAVIVGLVFLATALFLDSTDETRSRLTFRGALGGYRAVLSDPTALLVYATVASEGLLILGLLPFVAAMVMLHGAAGSFEAGIVIAAFAAGGMTYGLAVRYVVAALGQWRMMRLGGLFAGTAFMMMAAPIPWIGVAGLFFVVGFGFYMLHNTMQLRATELAPTVRGSAISLFASSFFFGQGIGPVLGGIVVHVAGLGTLFFAAGVLTIALGFGTAALISKRVASL